MRRTAVVLLILGLIITAGCTAPVTPPQADGTIPVTSVPVPSVSTQSTLPVTFVTTTGTAAPANIPQIHVDGYWTFPVTTDTTTNPRQILVHTESFNVGTADAREVTVAANFYYNDHMVCWNTIYLGTLTSGGHVAKDSMVSCTLPSPLNSQDLVVRFENLAVTP